eukprot:2936476-Amphidinium_carterae.1
MKTPRLDDGEVPRSYEALKGDRLERSLFMLMTYCQWEPKEVCKDSSHICSLYGRLLRQNISQENQKTSNQFPFLTFCPGLIVRKRTTPGDAEGYNPPNEDKALDKSDAPALIDDAALAAESCKYTWFSPIFKPTNTTRYLLGCV